MNHDFFDRLGSVFKGAVEMDENMSERWGLTAKKLDFDAALSQDSWTAREAICWLHGRNPAWCRGDIEEHFRDEVDLVKRAIKSNKLSSECTSPEQWIGWAVSKGWKIPEYLFECTTSGQNDETFEKGGRNTALTSVTRNQIKLIFEKLSHEKWRGHFGREKSNGLSQIRIGEKGSPKYDLEGLKDWLIYKGLYKPCEIDDALKKYEGMAEIKGKIKGKASCLGEQLADSLKRR